MAEIFLGDIMQPLDFVEVCTHMENVSTVMSTRVVTVEPDDSLETVKEIFSHTHFHQVLVIEYDRLVGMVSDRDLFKAISPYVGTAAEISRDRATLNKRVHQIMQRKLTTLEPDASLEEAAELMTKNRVTCIPIIDPLQQVKGILSWRDILSALIKTRSKSSDPVDTE